MKLFVLYLLIFGTLFYQNLHPMHPQAAAVESVNKDLIIKNEYVDQIEVEYIREDKPNTPIKLRVQPQKESEVIPNVNTLKSLKFAAYGMLQGFLNFNDPINYRIKYNSYVWQKTPYQAVLYITVAGGDDEPKTNDEAMHVHSSSSSQPVEWKGWGATAWRLGASAWEKTAAGAAYATQLTKEQVLPRVKSFKVTPGIIKKEYKKPNDDPFQGKTFQGKPLAELFPAAQARIQACGYFLGRDILNLTRNYKVVEANELKKLVSAKWLNWRDIYNQDPQALVTIADVLNLIEDAADNPDKIFAKELLGC